MDFKLSGVFVLCCVILSMMRPITDLRPAFHGASDFQTVLDIRFLLFAGFLLLRNIFDVFIQKSKSVYPVVHFEVTADL